MENYCKCFFFLSGKQPNISSRKNGDKDYKVYSLEELVHGTNNFHNDNKIGEGGFGSVYWGRTSKGVEITVKRLEAMSSKAEMEFAVEVEIAGRIRHGNLLALRGYCFGRDERLIVYDYMPNRSLLSHLHGQLAAQCLLDWPRRMKIAIGLAEGLAYLHHETAPHIIHRHVNSGNVLLDSEFKPKLAGYGFAKLIPEEISEFTTRVKGTLGYIAPEYAMWGKVSRSCDVYSFGILLLEIISGRKPLEKIVGGIKCSIVQWASPYVENGDFDEIADPKLNHDFDCDQLKNVITIAVKCTHNAPESRPSMLEVVGWLKRGFMVQEGDNEDDEMD